MTRHPRPPSPNPPPPPPPPPAPADPDPDFDPVAEWLLDLDDDVDFDQAMASEFDKTFGLGDEEVFPLPGEIEPTGCDVAIPVLEDDGVMSGIGELGVDPVKEDVVGEKDELLDLFDAPSGVEFDVEKEEAVILGGGLDAQPGPDQHPLLGVSDLVAKEDSLDGAIDADMSSVAAADAEMFALPAVETEMVTAAPVEAEMSTVASVHAALSSEVSVNEEVEGGGGKGVEESKGEDSESSEDEEDEESDESSSSSDEEEEMTKEDVESSEASSSSDDEVLMGKKQGRVTDMEALLEEGELMVGIDDDDEGEAGKGPIKSKNEVKELPPVPKIEVQLEPHHKALPVGAISAIMGERVIVEGSVEHSPLTEGSILWITESRTPLGIVDELFGPVKNPYYLVRYNTTEEVPAGISAGTTVSFVAEFANHILNMKELYAKGYDESADHDEEADEPEFSDDEKEAEYKRSLRQSKRQTDRQHESKKSFGDKKRVQHRGAGFRKDMPPRVHGSPTLGQQSQHRFHHSDMPPAVADSVTRRSGPQNFPMSAPTMLPPIPMNHAVPSAVQLANQMGSCFINPSQQFSPQQQNMVWPGGLPPPPQPNIGVDGAAFAANIMQNILIGANQYQQYLQNQNFGGFPNGMPMAPPQFMPGSGMPVNPMQFGAPPVNHPFDPASQNIGQGNFGPASQNMGQGNFGPASQNMGQGNFGPAPQNMGQENFGQLPHMAGDQGPPPGFPNAQGYGGIPTLHENGDQPPGFPSTQGYGRLPSPHGGGGQPPMQFNSGQFNQGNSSFRGRKPQQRGGRQSRGRGGGGRHRR